MMQARMLDRPAPGRDDETLTALRKTLAQPWIAQLEDLRPLPQLDLIEHAGPAEWVFGNQTPNLVLGAGLVDDECAAVTREWAGYDHLTPLLETAEVRTMGRTCLRNAVLVGIRDNRYVFRHTNPPIPFPSRRACGTLRQDLPSLAAPADHP